MASPQAVLPETKSQENLTSSGSVSSGLMASSSTSSLANSATSGTARELRFSLGQVIVMWSVILGSMVAVFLFGLFTGREQGMKLALETQEQYAQRLPINRDAEGGDKLAANRAQEITVPVPAPVVEAAPSTLGQALSADVINKPKDSVVADSMSAPLPPVVSQPVSQSVSPPLAPPRDAVPASPSLVATAPANNAPAKSVAAKEVQSAEKPEAVTTLASLASKLEQVKTPVVGASVGDVASVAAKNEAPKVQQQKVESPKAEQAKPAPLTAGGNLAKGWYVQVAAAKSQSEVDGFAAKLKKIGLKAQLEIAVVRNVKYYRVMSGPFKTQAAAAGAQKKIKDAKVSLSTPFTKQVS